MTTTSTPEKAQIAEAAGADHVIPYEDFPAKVRQITNGEGVPVVYDGVGASTFEGSLESLAIRGTLVLYGERPVRCLPMISRTSTGAAGSTSLAPRSTGTCRIPRSARGDTPSSSTTSAKGLSRCTSGRPTPWLTLSQAHEDLESRRTAGKLLLKP
ncbi:zinc-binding dehydrogenase [Nesterenkonia pannonica]|uniref:zinc-binding dehydrogenase n=1 Tax=Nesterenkonia pannonica TaxID=1548602 RepID=UPI002164C1E2|nr:zinc-binding dehydrogenase [Nesterenkonia pannonica]